jgi:asparagine synthase (glutamine-hydrolysing)
VSAIAGLWRLDRRPDAERACAAMLDAQRCYGPHDSRSWSGDDGIALGRNLWGLVPEDAFDVQPLIGGGGRFVLAADLRLDNREELVESLGIGGERAAQAADASLLLAAWEKWGEASLTRIVGDFAFALWDRERRALFLARDFAGSRPLHFHRSPGLIAFATMPRGLHALPEIPRAPDLGFAARTVAEGRPPLCGSWFEGVERVRPGHLLVADQAAVSQRRWWHPPTELVRLKSPDEYAEALRDQLDRATASRVRGQKRVAAHLSGGLDSSAVATSAARLVGGSGRVTAFTAVPRAGYCASRSTPMLEEGPLAAETAAAWPNIELVQLPAAGPLPLEELDLYVSRFEQPLPNLCNMHWTAAIAEAARSRGLNVLLTGQFGNFAFSSDGTPLLPDLLRRGRLLSLGRHMSAMRRTGYMPLRSSAAAALRPLLAAAISAVRRRTGRSAGHALAGEREIRLRPFEANDVGSLGKGILAGWGVDCRDPTADRRLVEFTFTVPPEEFLRGGIPRSLARRALAGRVPQSVLSERRKAVQAPDWHEPAAAQREALAREVEAIAASAAAALVPVEQLRAMVAGWDQADWSDPATSRLYRAVLLRHLSLGHFIGHAGRG